MSVNGTRKTILVVDDDTSVRRLIARRVQSFGYTVVTVESGEQALHLVQEQPPDLILLDIMMPKMKGRDVCKHLKEQAGTAHIPVIFLTALGLADHVKAGMDLGAEDYIVKPFEREINGARFENGLVVDPALLLHFGAGIVFGGLDIGFIYRGENVRQGVISTDQNQYVLHVIPKVGVKFGGHKVVFAMGFQDEDYMLGIPLVGKNHKANEIPPMSLSWQGSF